VFNRVRKYFEFNRIYKVKYPLKRKWSLKEIITALKVVFFLGVVDKNRKYFWKIITLVLKKNYKYLDSALLFSLILHQYSVLREENISDMKKAIAA
jgi:hypothetical protein